MNPFFTTRCASQSTAAHLANDLSLANMTANMLKPNRTSFPNINAIHWEHYWEILAFIFFSVALVFTMAPLLIHGNTALRHDNFYNYYPAFQFLADSLLNGRLPLWNPWTHAGEPFYPILIQERLLEPITWLSILVGNFFTDDFVLLCSWNRFIQSWVMVFGTYLVLRPIASHLLVRLFLIPVLFFSSFFLGSFHQEGILHQFLWVPYVAYFLYRLFFLKDYRWFNWGLLTAAIGVNFQTYFFVGTWLFLLIYLLSAHWFHPGEWKQFFSQPKLKIKFCLSGSLLLLTMVPNIVLLLDAKNMVFPMRMFSEEEAYLQKISRLPGPMQYEGTPKDIHPSVKMPYRLIQATGVQSTPADYFQLIYPRGNPELHGSTRAWGNTSEAYLYLGILTWFIALFGIFFGKDIFKKTWLTLLGTFFFLSLGATGILHRVLYPILPLLWGMRNSHCLTLFVQFGILYFFVIGLNRLTQFWTQIDASGEYRRELILQFWNALRAKWIWLSILTGCLVEIFIWLDTLSMPKNFWIGPVFLSVIFFLLFMSRKVGAGIVYGALILSQIILVWFFCVDKVEFANYFLICAGLPILVLMARITIFNTRALSLKENLFLLLLVCSAHLTDLYKSVEYAWPLYRGQPHPEKYLNVRTQVQKTEFPEFREPHEFYPLVEIQADPPLEQLPRYLSILFRKPYALSARFLRRGGDAMSFSEALKGKRWNSFLELKNYFHLVHSGLDPVLLEGFFAVNRSVFQFNTTAHLLEATELSGQFLEIQKLSVSMPGKYSLFIEEGKQNSKSDFSEGNRKLSYKVNEYGINRVKLEVFVPQSGYFYWADGYDKHWRSFVDGIETKILKANINFKAIFLKEGKHELQFYYDPILVKLSLLIFYAALLFCFLTSSFSGSISHYLKTGKQDPY